MQLQLTTGIADLEAQRRTGDVRDVRLSTLDASRLEELARGVEMRWFGGEQLRGLPPETGLYASTVPLVLYALFGTSRQLAVGPVAIVSLNSSVTPWWSLSAFALISVTPLALIAVVVERFMSRGSLAGAFR